MARKGDRALTKRQAAVLAYIIACVEKEHRTPTIRQIGAKFNLRSTGNVRGVLRALVEKDEITRDPALSRGIRLNPRKYKVVVSAKKR
jgi:SOS-response transcriptional repressor LexA